MDLHRGDEWRDVSDCPLASRDRACGTAFSLGCNHTCRWKSVCCQHTYKRIVSIRQIDPYLCGERVAKYANDEECHALYQPEMLGVTSGWLRNCISIMNKWQQRGVFKIQPNVRHECTNTFLPPSWRFESWMLIWVLTGKRTLRRSATNPHMLCAGMGKTWWFIRNKKQPYTGDITFFWFGLRVGSKLEAAFQQKHASRWDVTCAEPTGGRFFFKPDYIYSYGDLLGSQHDIIESSNVWKRQ